MILRYDQGMNTHTGTNVKIIENASPDDIQAGDHVAWEWGREMGGVIITERREGTAHHRDEEGNWHSKDGIWLAGAVWPWQETPTITIRRALNGDDQ